MLSVTRTLAGAAIAVAIALLARRARSLSSSGAVGAAIVGTIAVAAGWGWGILLLAFFVSSSLLSHLRRAEKEEITAKVVDKAGERDIIQVLANGGLFAAAAVGILIAPAALAWQAIAAGALAAAASDTWATEIGTLSRRRPRLILTGRRVATGTSGGITLLGLLGSALGAAFIELMVVQIHWPPQVAAAALFAGVAGSVADSLLGATLQQRRWCEHCRQATERPTHPCGNATRISGGFSWMTNDAVNAISTLVGGAVALALATV